MAANIIDNAPEPTTNEVKVDQEPVKKRRGRKPVNKPQLDNQDLLVQEVHAGNFRIKKNLFMNFVCYHI